MLTAHRAFLTCRAVFFSQFVYRRACPAVIFATSHRIVYDSSFLREASRLTGMDERFLLVFREIPSAIDHGSFPFVGVSPFHWDSRHSFPFPSMCPFPKGKVLCPATTAQRARSCVTPPSPPRRRPLTATGFGYYESRLLRSRRSRPPPPPPPRMVPLFSAFCCPVFFLLEPFMAGKGNGFFRFALEMTS